MSSNVRYPNVFSSGQDPRSQILSQSMQKNQGNLNQLLKETQMQDQQALRLQQQLNQVSIQQQIQSNQQSQFTSQISVNPQQQSQQQQQKNATDRIRLSMQSPRTNMYSHQNNQQQNNSAIISNGLSQVQNQNINQNNISANGPFSNKKVTPTLPNPNHPQVQAMQKSNIIEDKDLNRQSSVGISNNGKYANNNPSSKPLFESSIIQGTSNPGQKLISQRKSSVISQQNMQSSQVTTVPGNLQNVNIPQGNVVINNTLQEGPNTLQKQRSYHQITGTNGAFNQGQVPVNGMIVAGSNALPLQNMTNIISNNSSNTNQSKVNIQTQQQQYIVIPNEDPSQQTNQGYIVAASPIGQERAAHSHQQNIYIQQNGATQSLRQSQVFQNKQQQLGQQQQPNQNLSQILQSPQILSQPQQQSNVQASQILGSPLIQLANSPNKPLDTEVSSVEMNLENQYYLNQLQANQIQLQQYQVALQQNSTQQGTYLIQQQQPIQPNQYTQQAQQIGSPTSASQKIKYTNGQAPPQSMTSSQINMNSQNNASNSRIKQIYNSTQTAINQQNTNGLSNSRYLIQQQQNQSLGNPVQMSHQQNQPVIQQITLLNDQSSQWSAQQLPNSHVQEKYTTIMTTQSEHLEQENTQLKLKLLKLEEQNKEINLSFTSQQNYLQDLEKKIKMLIQQNEKLQTANENGPSEVSQVIINQLKQERDQLNEENHALKVSQQNSYNEEQIKTLVINLEQKMQELVIENERINNILTTKYSEIEQLQKMQESYIQIQNQNKVFHHLVNEGQNEYKLKIQTLETENIELKTQVKELRNKVKQTEQVPDLELVVKDFEQKINSLVEENNRLNDLLLEIEQKEIEKQRNGGDKSESNQTNQYIQEISQTNQDLKDQVQYWKKKCVEFERKKLLEPLTKEPNTSSLQGSASKQVNIIQQNTQQVNDKMYNVQNTRIVDLETKLNYVLQENDKLNNILTEQISITQQLAKSSANLKQNKSQTNSVIISGLNNKNTNKQSPHSSNNLTPTSSASQINNNENFNNT